MSINIAEDASTLVVLDFETTGLSPAMGERAIEIGAVRIENGEITAQFQELMNPGKRVNSFIEQYTGISNEMLADARPCAEVMTDFAKFIDGYNLLAHNASFDKAFLDNELELIQSGYNGEFTCSLLVARRIFQNASSFKLSNLVNYANIDSSGAYHRALYDSDMTAKLWLRLLDSIREQAGIDDVPFELVKKISKTPKKNINKLFTKL